MLPLSNPKTAYWEIGNGGAFEFEEIPDGYLEQAKDRRAGVYFTVNQLGDQRNDKGNLRHRGNVTHLLACFVDFDDGDKSDQMSRIRGFTQPSCIVESGRGYHAYWELREPVPIAHEHQWTLAQQKIALSLGGDISCKDPARLMRLPGSWHVKEGYEPSLVRIVELNPVRYSLDDFSGDPPPPEKRTKSSYVPLRGVPRPSVLPPNTRHNALLEMAGRLFRGASRLDAEERTAVLKAWYVSSCYPLKPYWEREVENVVKWVKEHEFHG